MEPVSDKATPMGAGHLNKTMQLGNVERNNSLDGDKEEDLLCPISQMVARERLKKKNKYMKMSSAPEDNAMALQEVSIEGVYDSDDSSNGEPLVAIQTGYCYPYACESNGGYRSQKVAIMLDPKSSDKYVQKSKLPPEKKRKLMNILPAALARIVKAPTTFVAPKAPKAPTSTSPMPPTTSETLTAPTSSETLPTSPETLLAPTSMPPTSSETLTAPTLTAPELKRIKKNAKNRSRKLFRRAAKKARRIKGLHVYGPSEEHKINGLQLPTNPKKKGKAIRPLFFSGKEDIQGLKKSLKDDCKPNARVKSVHDTHMVDTTEGAVGVCHDDVKAKLAFLLVPREKPIQKILARSTFDLLEKVQNDPATKPCVRASSIKRQTHSETNDMYSTTGTSPNRNGKGIIDSGANKSEAYLEIERTLKQHLVDLTAEYLDTSINMGLKDANDCYNFLKMTKGKLDYWNGMATGLNAQLNAHFDEDMMYCCMTAISKTDKRKYSLDENICSYMVFPSLGVSVAIRPGDVLLFNPTVWHCISSRTEDQKDDYYPVSFYLKTEVVTGHNKDALYPDEE
jgi:hypothetical protein